MVSSVELKQVWISAAAAAPKVLRLVVAEDMASELVVELAVERMVSELVVELTVRFRSMEGLSRAAIYAFRDLLG